MASKNLTHTELGRLYLQQHKMDTIYTRGQWYRYLGGYWQVIHDLAIKKEIWNLLETYEALDQARPTDSTQRSVLNFVQAELFIPEVQVDGYPNLINLLNGVFNLDDGNLYPHRPEYYLTTQLPFGYEPTAIAPTWLDYIYSTFTLPKSTQYDPELAAFVQEAMGYSLTTDVSLQVFFLCLGEGSNGKGVWFFILEKLGGSSAIPLNLNLLRKEQYQLATLAGKRIALCSEANASDNLVDDAIIKALVAGDTLMVRMIKREPFTLHPIAKLWWAMNRLPNVADTSFGFWRRVLTIPFNRIFMETEKIPNLKEQLIDELPGIFNWAIEGLMRLRARGDFEVPSQVKTLNEKYQKESNIIRLFVEENCEVGSTYSVQSADIYQRFKEWCFLNNYKAHSSRGFKREMEALGYFTKHGNSGTIYENIKLKP
jgi:putative DNA primase/helicase